MLEQRKKASYEYQKRIRVLQRKNDIDKISDAMSFVNNSEHIWEFLGQENDLQDQGLTDHDDLILELISKDQLELQKYKLKRDADLLNQIFVFDESGNIFSRKELLPLMKGKHPQRASRENESSSSDSSFQDEGYVRQGLDSGSY